MCSFFSRLKKCMVKVVTAMNREVLVYSVAGAVGLSAAAFGAYFLGRKIINRYRVKSSGHEEFHGGDNEMVNCFLSSDYCPPEEYMDYDFGPKDALNYHKRCADICIKNKADGVLSRALDVGCGVGRCTFELTRGFEEAVGLELSKDLHDACEQLKLTGEAEFSVVVEGELKETKQAVVDPSIDRGKATFLLGDVCDFDAQLGKFGCVFAGNVLYMMQEPRKFLVGVGDIIVPDGVLVISSCYCWGEQFSPKSQWLGGYMEGGREVRGFDTIKQLLSPQFELVERLYVPWLYRESLYSFMWMVADTTVWKRKIAKL